MQEDGEVFVLQPFIIDKTCQTIKYSTFGFEEWLAL